MFKFICHRLIGKGGCIDLNVTRSSYKAYKPHLNSPFPEVNGKVSNECYLNAFDSCFIAYRKKMNAEWRPISDDQVGDEKDLFEHCAGCLLGELSYRLIIGCFMHRTINW